MKLLVIGSEGFIGSYICLYCAKLSIKFIPINRKEWNNLQKNNFKKWIITNEITSIIFCGGYSKRFETKDIEKIDELETINILLRATKVRLIYLSSSLVYDLEDQSLENINLTENSNIAPSGAYGMYKRLIERMVLQSSDKNCVLRLVSCIGKRKKTGLMQNLEKQIISKSKNMGIQLETIFGLDLQLK